MKHNPEAFFKAIQRQNQNLQETWVLKVEGFTSEAIEACTSALLSQPGSIQITPSNNNAEQGEWKILIKNRNYSHMIRGCDTTFNKSSRRSQPPLDHLKITHHMA